jgi:hypothetical protein
MDKSLSQQRIVGNRWRRQTAGGPFSANKRPDMAPQQGQQQMAKKGGDHSQPMTKRA